MNHLPLPKLANIGMMAVLMNVAMVSFTATDTLYLEYVSCCSYADKTLMILANTALMNMTKSDVQTESSPVAVPFPDEKSLSPIFSLFLALLNPRLTQKAIHRHRKATMYVIRVFLTLLIVLTERFSQ